MRNSWGGSWTLQKLEAFEAYVKAYLVIMHSTRNKYYGWPHKIIYFDGFAGSGSQFQNQSKEYIQTLKDFGINAEEQNVYKGSVERVLKLEKRFDEYIFVDIDKNAIKTLQKRLQNNNANLENCTFLKGDVNEQLINFLNKWNNDNVALVLLDPFGMQVKWKTIEQLKDKRVDLWILLPSGVIINRLLDRNGELIHSDLLQKHLGLNENEIFNIFYSKKTILTLFEDNITIIEKKKNTIQLIADCYVNQLKKIFKHVTENPLKLKNSRNTIIYHFIFASNNDTALKIASQIIEKKQT